MGSWSEPNITTRIEGKWGAHTEVQACFDNCSLHDEQNVFDLSRHHCRPESQRLPKCRRKQLQCWSIKEPFRIQEKAKFGRPLFRAQNRRFQARECHCTRGQILRTSFPTPLGAAEAASTKSAATVHAGQVVLAVMCESPSLRS